MAKLRYVVAFGLVLLGARFVAFGCTPGGVGDPCIPEDEYSPTFSGFGETEANVESRSFQCSTGVCMVNHFRGRVTCPYGQTEGYVVANAANARNIQSTPDPGLCYTPTSNAEAVTVAVEPQLLDRRADDAVYCSCRCAGPDKAAKYCTCPAGYSCSPLIPDLGFDKAELVGSYCMKNGTEYTGYAGGRECSFEAGNCPSRDADTSRRNPVL